MEYWLIYDLATGALLMPGQGSPGMTALQVPPEGSAILPVPYDVVRTPGQIDLVALKAYLASRIDVGAETTRLQYLTPGMGQALTYQRKEAEARAWSADDTAPIPFLAAEAPARGMTIAALAAEVIALADAWTAIGSAIEGVRMGAKTRLAAAGTFAEIVLSGEVDWSVIHAAG